MKKSKDIEVGEQVGYLLITKIERPIFYGLCKNCGKENKINSSHVNYILGGRGKGCHCSRRRTNATSEYKWRYESYRQAAQKRNLSFLISFDNFMDIVKRNCYYCNAEPEMRPTHHKRWDFKFPMSGIDRVNPKIGYELENIVPCCSHCNRAKWDYTAEEFKSWIKRVYYKQFQEVVSA